MIRTEPTIGRLGGAPSCLPMFKKVLRRPSELALLIRHVDAGVLARLHKLLLIREWSWHPRLPLRYGGSVPIRHLHLRQRRLIQDIVLLNHAVLVK